MKLFLALIGLVSLALYAVAAPRPDDQGATLTKLEHGDSFSRLSERIRKRSATAPVGTSTLASWAGASVVATAVSTVAATITVPTPSWAPVAAAAPTQGGSFYDTIAWIGIDGNAGAESGCNGLWQAGIVWQAYYGVDDFTYSLWYEWFPMTGVLFNSSFVIGPGDVLSMELIATSKTSGIYKVYNANTNQSDEASIFAPSEYALCLETADWIVEFSGDAALTQQVDFGTVTFSNATFTTTEGVTGDVAGAKIFQVDNNDGQALTNCDLTDDHTVRCVYGSSDPDPAPGSSSNNLANPSSTTSPYNSSSQTTGSPVSEFNGSSSAFTSPTPVEDFNNVQQSAKCTAAPGIVCESNDGIANLPVPWVVGL